MSFGTATSWLHWSQVSSLSSSNTGIQISKLLVSIARPSSKWSALFPPLLGVNSFLTKAFYLKVSDSSHATYVSLPDDHNDLISSDKIQLGQYIHVDRLEASTPVPILRGIRPIPGRHPCVGNPEDIVATSSLGFLNGSKDNLKLLSKSKVVKTNVSTKAQDLGSRKAPLSKASSFNLKPLLNKEGVGIRPRSMNTRVLPSSPTSCYSLSATFEKFSDGIKQQAKVKGAAKVSTSSRLGLLDRAAAAPTAGRNNSSNRKLLGKSLSCIEMGPKALRRSWEGRVDMKGSSMVCSRDEKLETKSDSRIAPLPTNENLSPEAESKTLSPLSQRKKSQCPVKKVNATATVDNPVKLRKPRPPTVKKVNATATVDNPVKLRKPRPPTVKRPTYISNNLSLGNLMKVVPSCSRKLTDGSISWASLPSPLAKLGKEVMMCRDAAQAAAIEAIQEASAAESLVRCLSMYAELTSKAKEDKPHPIVEQFLNFNSTLSRATLIFNSLLQLPPISFPSSGNPSTTSEESLKLSSTRQRHARSWVTAALSTDLSPFSLYTHKAAQSPLSIVLDSPKSASPEPQASPPGPSRGKLQAPLVQSPTLPPSMWERGGGVEVKAELVRALKDEAGRWFLKFVEGFLDADVSASAPPDREKVAGMMLQLKNVNEWLDGITTREKDGEDGNEDEGGDGGCSVPIETIGRVRKKIYGYLLTHVESAAVAAGRGSTSRDRQVRKL